MRKGLSRPLALLLSSTAAAFSAAAGAAAFTSIAKHPHALFLHSALGPPVRSGCSQVTRPSGFYASSSLLIGGPGSCLTSQRSLIATSSSRRDTARAKDQEQPAQQVETGDEMARATRQTKGTGTDTGKGKGGGAKTTTVQSARGKKGAAAKAKKQGGAGRGTKKQEQPPQLQKGTQMRKQQKKGEKEAAPATPRRSPRKKASTGGGGGGGARGRRKPTIAKPSRSEKRGQGRKPVEDLEPDVEEMATKVGVQLPKDTKKKKKEVEAAIAKTSDRPYREYSKQGALEELKKTHKVVKKGGTQKGDAFSGSRRSSRSKPPPEENKKPPTQRRTKRGTPSARGKLANEANRPLADALYELADFVIHGDTTQKGIAYQKAAKSVREAPKRIKSGAEARKLVGVGRSVADKIDEFLNKRGKIKVLEEYRRGERGK